VNAIPKDDLQRLISIRFDMVWGYVALFRNFVAGYLQNRLDARNAERLAMIAQELLENAMKYGSSGVDIEVELLVSPVQRSTVQRTFQVRVSNDAIDTRIALLKKEMARIQQLPPESAFLQSMQLSSKRVPGITMLGLSRIRFEGKVDLRVDVAPPKVTVSAQGRL
jgi:hypothetical protein